MRIHCLENVDKALSFLYEQRVHLENMGAHDIVDGNPRLTLGNQIPKPWAAENNQNVLSQFYLRVKILIEKVPVKG